MAGRATRIRLNFGITSNVRWASTLPLRTGFTGRPQLVEGHDRLQVHSLTAGDMEVGLDLVKCRIHILVEGLQFLARVADGDMEHEER